MIYIALEQLKTQIKPVEKTFVEKYGLIIGACVGIAGGIITFLLTALKDWISKSKEEKRNDKKFRMEIFTDLYAQHHELQDVIKDRDELVIVISEIKDNATVLHSVVTKDDLKAVDDLNEKIKNLIYKFESKLGFYLFNKDYNSTTIIHMNRIKNIGINFVPEAYSKNSPFDEFKHYHKLRVKHQNFFFDNVESPINEISIDILKNK